MPTTPPPLQILASSSPPTTPRPKTLFILDSSFNPPTTAHLHLARSALFSQDERSGEGDEGDDDESIG
ncbi:hypothetical protein V496_06676 [Pseudogymnoascus sp. VKM F-4515 (FW-2607)]|nr:hypothetical protein V496_06676 [Pseudogymnoascus sp. VKM F-4515 (FW-2607)]